MHFTNKTFLDTKKLVSDISLKGTERFLSAAGIETSIAQLGQNILEQLEEIVPQDMETPVGVGNEVIDALAKETGLSAEKALERLDEMSDSEVEAMLSQMLDSQEEQR